MQRNCVSNHLLGLMSARTVIAAWEGGSGIGNSHREKDI